MKIREKRKSIGIVALAVMMAMVLTSVPSSAISLKPEKVVGLKAARYTYTKLKLKWKKADLASGYVIYRATSKKGKFKRIKTVTKGRTLSYIDPKRVTGKTYYYKVRAYNTTLTGKKRYSPYSSVVSNRTVLSKPVMTLAKYTRFSNKVTWKKVPGATGYLIYRQDASGGKFTRVGKTKTLIFIDETAKKGMKYNYRMRAYRYHKSVTGYSGYTDPGAITTEKKVRVFVACGHGTDTSGRWDGGATWNGLTEAGLMLPITKAAVKYLRASGFKVYTDADTENDANMVKDVSRANRLGVEAYVSIHCDWYKAKAGTIPLYRTSEDLKLATALNKAVLGDIDIKTRGVFKRTDLYEINCTTCKAACIFETGSISKDYKIFQEQYDEYGKALAKGFCNYFGVKFVDPHDPVEPVTPEPLVPEEGEGSNPDASEVVDGQTP